MMQPGRMGWDETDPLFPVFAEAAQQRQFAQNSAQQAASNPMPTRGAAIANLANVLLSRFMESRAGDQMKRAQAALIDDRQRELSKIVDSMQPRTFEAAGPPNPDGTLPTETRQPDRRTMLANLLAARDPMFKAMGVKMMEGELFPQPRKLDRVDLGGTVEMVDEQGNTVRVVPKTATPDATMREQGADRRHTTPSGDTELREFNRRDVADADRSSRETIAEQNRQAENARAEASRNLQRDLHGTVSANTAFTQTQENERFNAMPVETAEGFVPRRQAAGKQGKPSASSGPPDRDFDNARQTYNTMFGSAMYGMRPNAPSFQKWLAEEWPKIRAAGGMTPPGSPTSPNQIPMGPAPAAPQRGVADTLPPREQRTPGGIYPTPRGPMKWTGTGWLPAN